MALRPRCVRRLPDLRPNLIKEDIEIKMEAAVREGDNGAGGGRGPQLVLTLIVLKSCHCWSLDEVRLWERQDGEPTGRLEQGSL